MANVNLNLPLPDLIEIKRKGVCVWCAYMPNVRRGEKEKVNDTKNNSN